MVMGNLDKLLAFNKETRGSGAQVSLFGDIGGIEIKLSLEDVPVETVGEKLTWEKDLLGLYISGHPLNAYKEKIEKFGVNVKDAIGKLKVNSPIKSVVIIDEVKIVNTKKNDRMAFLKVSDHTGSIDAVVFSKLFEANKEMLEKDTIIAYQGKITERNGEKSIMIEGLKRPNGAD
jgi:DNA polymerase-3 subunit alpha